MKIPRTALVTGFCLMMGRPGPDCGAEFNVGERYLVTAGENSIFDDGASGKMKMLSTSRCSSTAPVGRATAGSFTELNRSYQRWVP